LVNLYPVVPENLELAVKEALKFIDGGEEHRENNESKKPRVYSWKKDSSFIFSAFKQTHGIDLSKDELHWWVFLALFMDLGADTAFSRIINLRSRIKSGKATKEERSAARDMGDMFDVEDDDIKSVEDIENRDAFMSKVRQHVRS
jgi:hypothetical protein